MFAPSTWTRRCSWGKWATFHSTGSRWGTLPCRPPTGQRAEQKWRHIWDPFPPETTWSTWHNARPASFCFGTVDWGTNDAPTRTEVSLKMMMARWLRELQDEHVVIVIRALPASTFLLRMEEGKWNHKNKDVYSKTAQFMQWKQLSSNVPHRSMEQFTEPVVRTPTRMKRREMRDVDHISLATQVSVKATYFTWHVSGTSDFSKIKPHSNHYWPLQFEKS